MNDNGLPIRHLAWAAALLPFLTSHVSYLIAASMGHVDWCVPYWDSCTSISATGRQLPEKLWFKFGMIPAALLTALLWWSLWLWLRRKQCLQGLRSLAAMPWLGTVAALFLVLYTVALGEEGEAYQRVRRTGIILTFALTYLAQLLFTHLLGVVGRHEVDSHLRRWHDRLFALSSLLLAVGVTSVILDVVLGAGYSAIEDAFEWVLALLLNLYFAGTALMLGPYRVSLSLVTDGFKNP